MKLALLTALAVCATASAAPGASDEQIQDDERPGNFGNRAGVVFKLGLLDGVSTVGDHPMVGFHGRVGLRLGLLDRSDDPGRGNVALAVLFGGDATNLARGVGAEARIEVTGGGKSDLYEPAFTAFAGGGFQNLWFDSKPELHLGFGAGMDLIFSGVLGQDISFGTRYFHEPKTALTVGAIVAFLLAPSVEFRWVQRPDGTTYKVALFSFAV